MIFCIQYGTVYTSIKARALSARRLSVRPCPAMLRQGPGRKDGWIMKKLLTGALSLLMAAGLLAGCKSLPKIEVSSVEDLNGLKIGVQSGTTGETYAKENLEATVSGFKSGMDAALDLKNGGLDAIILDELPAKSIVAQNSDLTIVDLDLEPEEYAIAVKKGNTELVNQINATLAKMKEDGSYDALTAAYMPADGKITIPEALATEGAETLTMGTNAAFAPFEYLEGTEIVGFDVSLSQAIAADQGKKLVIENMEFDALISALSAGQVDFVAAGMSVTPERLENVDFTDAYYSSKQVIILRK